MGFQYSLRIIFFTMTLGLWLRAKADFYTAIAHMEPLLNTYKKVVDDIEEYIGDEEKRLEVLKKHLNRYKMEQTLATGEVSNYLENPINAFILIKRLTVDLDFLQNSILASSDDDNDLITNIPHVLYPALEDLTGAIQGLARLQDTYCLEIGELAEGKLIERNSRGSKDPVISTPMTASDCFELGQTLFHDGDYHKGLLWIMESLRKVTNGDDLFNVTEVNILEYLSSAQYHLGDIKSAIEWTNKILILRPDHQEASDFLKYLENMVDENGIYIKRSEEKGEHKDNNDAEGGDQSQTSAEYDEVLNIYKSLCRGDIETPREIQRRLKCSYLTKNHPFLKLAPIKMEQIYIGPDVFLFHEVLSDEEIEHIKNIATPQITRAEVVDADSGLGTTAPYRISKVTWVSEFESEIMERVTQRIVDFTGFSMDTAEDLQVANYGIGGHYEPHFDFDHEEFAFASAGGDRIATVLFYMSDVAQGGATVFTNLSLTVFPIKNTALFWLNLLPSGESDFTTMHAACPVLRGTKWAANKWIYNIGQELIKPCSVEV